MKSILSCSSILLVVLLTGFTANADIARPQPTPKKDQKAVLHTNLQIATDPNAGEAWLQIRESDLKQMLAAANGAQANSSLGNTITRSPARTITAGLLMFTSLSFAGVWFARSRRAGLAVTKSQKAVAIIVFAVTLIGAGTIVTRGNAGPPPYYRWRNVAENLAKGNPTYGSVNVAIVPDDQMEGGLGMRLVLPLKKKTGSGDE